MNGSLPIQIMKNAIAGFALIILLHISAMGQSVIGVINYLNVDNPEEFIELEKMWQEIHKERFKQKMISGWALYQVMFKTIEDPYNFITVSWYDSFSKLDKEIPEYIIEAVLPQMSKENWKAFEDKTNSTCTVVSAEVFHQRFTCAPKILDNQGNFVVVNEISVKPGQSKELLKLYEEIYKPLYEEDIRNQNRTNWSFWEKWPGNMKDFQYLSADSYIDLDQIGQPDFMQYFKKIHPNKNPNEISQQIESIRTLVNTEMWKVIYRIVE